jgi:hypothetical protein
MFKIHFFIYLDESFDCFTYFTFDIFRFNYLEYLLKKLNIMNFHLSNVDNIKVDKVYKVDKIDKIDKIDKVDKVDKVDNIENIIKNSFKYIKINIYIKNLFYKNLSHNFQKFIEKKNTYFNSSSSSIIKHPIIKNMFLMNTRYI